MRLDREWRDKHIEQGDVALSVAHGLFDEIEALSGPEYAQAARDLTGIATTFAAIASAHYVAAGTPGYVTWHFGDPAPGSRAYYGSQEGPGT
jgi:hypothetical protein